MNGIDPYAYMQQVAMKMDEISGREEIETVLDELEYLFESQAAQTMLAENYVGLPY